MHIIRVSMDKTEIFTCEMTIRLFFREFCIQQLNSSPLLLISFLTNKSQNKLVLNNCLTQIKCLLQFQQHSKLRMRKISIYQNISSIFLIVVYRTLISSIEISMSLLDLKLENSPRQMFHFFGKSHWLGDTWHYIYYWFV